VFAVDELHHLLQTGEIIDLKTVAGLALIEGGRR